METADPGSILQFADALYQKGSLQEAFDAYLKGHAANGATDAELAALKDAIAKRGITGYLQTRIAQLQKRGQPEQNVTPMTSLAGQLASLYTRLGDKDRAFQQLVADAVQTSAQRGRSYGRTLSVVRPSGRRSYATMVGPLLAPPPRTNLGEAVAILFVADPEGSQISTTQVLEGLYDLTPAEAELLRLLAEGNSLEQVADQRGVTMNTARSQLKQVFAKTDTRRQGELVRLVLTGVASLGDDGDR